MHILLRNGSCCFNFVFVFWVFISWSLCMPVSLTKSPIFVEDSFRSLQIGNHKVIFPYARYTSPSSCEVLKGVGTFDSTCILGENLHLEDDLIIYGTGNLEISSHVSVVCPIEGCLINLNFSGSITVGRYASLVAGSIIIEAANLTLNLFSSLNTTSLGGPPPAQTTGTPSESNGGGGGYGGRGASCEHKNGSNHWGGDAYSWSVRSEPWSYGSKGASKAIDDKFGGGGGGRIKLIVIDSLYLDGSVSAEGGNGGTDGGGGSGGSIIIHTFRLKGSGIISAAGGKGWGGGGGGRISLKCYSIQKEVSVKVHGGQSYGCPKNSGAAGTIFDARLLSLRVSNDNITTQTETPLLDFPTSPIWSNVYVEDRAMVLVPLVWTRVQVRGQISVLDGGAISFGLSDYPVSEFELVAEELLISDSVIKVYGAFRIYVKMLLMWNSKMQIDGGGKTEVGTSVLEVRNLVVLKQNSEIISNANLGVYGQGLLKLTGPGDAIKGQRLFLSLFYNIDVGNGSLLQAPLEAGMGNNLNIKSHCENQRCPMELIIPPDDCHVNYSLSFTLQICRVEDLTVSGVVKGSIIHIHRSKTVTIVKGGVMTASELGCKEGIGKGKYSRFGVGGGAGHGGRGGSGFYNGRLSDGGQKYGDPDLPCEVGSGSGGPGGYMEQTSGGGMIVMGSMKWPLTRLDIYGSLNTNGQSCIETRNQNGTSMGGMGGGSGGTVLLFLQHLTLGENSSLSLSGGHGCSIGGGGGGGGRVHFDWFKIAVGDEYVPIASVNGTINVGGGLGSGNGNDGEEGTMTGKKCPEGLYGTFCNECPTGTFKDVEGSDPTMCTACSLELLPYRANFIYVRGGVTKSSCPYKCVSDKYSMPNCYTPLEDLIYTFGGPWPFAILLAFTLVILAVLLSAVRIKFVGTDYSHHPVTSRDRHGPDPFPYLLSLAEVRGSGRAEVSQSHVHRMYFMGPNTFREPWHLPYSPPDAIIEIVYEDAFNRFIDEINSVAAYEWWEGSIHSILSVLAYPCAWSWKQWCRRNKIHRLQEYVKSEYDHACLRSCRSRALYQGMKVGSTPDLMVAYIEFFLGGDEKRHDMSSTQRRFPLCIIFGGDGSYMSPYNLYTDSLLTNIISQYAPPAMWNRFITGLNAQLRTVRQGSIRCALVPVISWMNSHGNPQLQAHGFRVELGWFQATASGYYQLGILVSTGNFILQIPDEIANAATNLPRKNTANAHKVSKQLQQVHSNVSHMTLRKRVTGKFNGGIINEATLQSLDYRRDILYPFSLLLHNTRPVGFKDTVQFLIIVLLLGDASVTLLTLLQFYWISLGAFLAILLVLPLSLLSPFPAGLNALFSRGLRRSSLARVYALWNVTSLSNILVAFICGLLHYVFLQYSMLETSNRWRIRRDDDKWWVLPTILLLIKSIQARFVDHHIANLEIEDLSLYSSDPERFWAGSLFVT